EKLKDKTGPRGLDAFKRHCLMSTTDEPNDQVMTNWVEKSVSEGGATNMTIVSFSIVKSIKGVDIRSIMHKKFGKDLNFVLMYNLKCMLESFLFTLPGGHCPDRLWGCIQLILNATHDPCRLDCSIDRATGFAYRPYLARAWRRIMSEMVDIDLGNALSNCTLSMAQGTKTCASIPGWNLLFGFFHKRAQQSVLMHRGGSMGYVFHTILLGDNAGSVVFNQNLAMDHDELKTMVLNVLIKQCQLQYPIWHAFGDEWNAIPRV
ncbi:hypothetical protein DP148_26890, partial [Salmonella enterica subsp. enterica serovar Typhimurium]